MAENKQQLMQLIQTASPSQLIKSDEVANRFQYLYGVIHGIRDNARAAAFYQAEQFHFLKIISDNKEIASCTKLSLYGIFLDGAVDGLSFDPAMKHTYVMAENVNIGTRDNPKYEKRAVRKVSPYGELLLRQLAGQVKYADNPVLVCESDFFKVASRGDRLWVEHEMVFPRNMAKTIACYIKLTRSDDTVDYKVLSREELEDIRKMSKTPNGPSWTKSYNGMFIAKTIKHAFKTYPKLRVGEFSKIDSMDEDVPAYDYGLDMSETTEQYQPENTTTNAPATETAATTTDENSFAQTTVTDTKPGVTHSDDDF